MNVATPTLTVDPILAEVTRTRLEAIGQEAGAAVERTAVSPIVTESKDYSVTIFNARGDIVSATSAIAGHYGGALNAVRSTIARYGDDVEDGDVFIVNDPHNGGGLHPPDVVVHQPVVVDGKVAAWVALAAHMMDVGGMAPGSTSIYATECFQEALRLPAVRLVHAGKELRDVWDIIRNNVRGAAIIEMDIRSLVIGGSVASRKLSELIAGTGVEMFQDIADTLISSTERAIRERVADLEPGRYGSVAWVEFGAQLFRVGCELTVDGDRLIFDITDAPPQVPHFINSKRYILRALIVPRVWALLAPNLPINQALYDVVEILTTPGTLVDSVMPAPIGAAHMDTAIPVSCAATHCLQLAVHASPRAKGREYTAAPQFGAYGTSRWGYAGPEGQRAVFTMMDGSFVGSPAGADRDGIDYNASLTGSGAGLEFPDIEVLETAYPVLFDRRSYRHGEHGYGQFRSGAGCEVAFGPHEDLESTSGNITGTRSWFPAEGLAGGLPGSTTRFAVVHEGGEVEALTSQALGAELNQGDLFLVLGASGGGFGDPLDRACEAVREDLLDHRLDRETAERIYGVVFGGDGEIDPAASETRRDSLRRERLAAAAPARRPVAIDSRPEGTPQPLYPGVVQVGRYAVAEQSGAVLAEAPDDWLRGCATAERPLEGARAEAVVRSYLDPLSGRLLHVSVDGLGQETEMAVWPDRWVNAALTGTQSPA